jgi:hypothetical protein
MEHQKPVFWECALDNVSKGIEYTIVQNDLVILSSLNFVAIFLATFWVFQEQIK